MNHWHWLGPSLEFILYCSVYNMSDLYRSAIGARLNKLPHLQAVAPSDVDDEEDETDDIGELPSMPPPGG